MFYNVLWTVIWNSLPLYVTHVNSLNQCSLYSDNAFPVDDPGTTKDLRNIGLTTLMDSQLGGGYYNFISSNI